MNNGENKNRKRDEITEILMGNREAMDPDVLKEYMKSAGDVRKEELKLMSTAIDSAFKVLGEGLKVYQGYLDLKKSKEETTRVLSTNKKDLKKIKADLENARISHEEFNERTVDIRRMMDVTIRNIEPLSNLMQLILKKGNFILEDNSLFDNAMNVNKQIVELITSLHRFMEKRR